MWVITKDGFYSAVQYRDVGKPLPERLKHEDMENIIAVRSRAREDSEAFVRHLNLSDGDIIESPMADYQFRVFVTREQWALYVGDAALTLDYKNFKSAIKDSKRHDIYMAVWTVLNRIAEKRYHFIETGKRSNRKGFTWEEPRLPFSDIPEDPDAVRVGGYFQNRGGKLVHVRGYKRRRA